MPVKIGSRYASALKLKKNENKREGEKKGRRQEESIVYIHSFILDQAKGSLERLCQLLSKLFFTYNAI